MCSPASALRHAHRARCLAHHTLSTPEPQGEPVAPRAAAAALVHTTRTPPAQPHTTFVCCAGQHLCPSTKLSRRSASRRRAARQGGRALLPVGHDGAADSSNDESEKARRASGLLPLVAASIERQDRWTRAAPGGASLSSGLRPVVRLTRRASRSRDRTPPRRSRSR